MDKVKIFEPLLNQFETEEIRDYCTDMIKEIPDYIFTIPSSTSGKYHNATQCETHGQIYHIYMFASVMNHLLRLEHKKEEFPKPKQRDCMRCVPIFHDAIKCGLNGSTYTVFNHPMLAGEWVRNTEVEHDLDDRLKEVIARMCERHSGEWTTSKRNKLVLPKPETNMEKLCHECDILASRADLDMIIPNELKELLGLEVPKEELPDINTYAITFGKYKGQSITDIANEHRDYLEWMKDNMSLREPLKTFVSELLK